MVWKIEIAMIGQLVGFLVRGKLTLDENFYKVLGREPLIIAPIDLATESGQFSAPTLLIKVLNLDILTHLVKVQS